MHDDVTVALTQNHVVLSHLAARLCATRDRKLRNALFDDLAKGLGGHFVALERVVVPSLLRAKAGLSSEVLSGLMALKSGLAALLALDRRTPEFETAMVSFCDAVELQADQEQLQLLPLLRQTLSARDRTDLGWEVAASLQSRLGDHPVLAMSTRFAEPPKTTKEELEEAHMVLSSLVTSAPPGSGSSAREGGEPACA